MKMFERNKKGQVFGMGILITIFAIIGLVAAVFFIANMNKDSSGLSVQPLTVTSVDGVTKELTFTEDVTVTFSSFDMFSLGTDAGSAHRIIELDGTISQVVADDSTKEKSPGNIFKVLLGNETDATGFTPGTTYYPTLVTGILPDDGTFTIGCNPASAECLASNDGGQARAAGSAQVTFTFTNEDGTANAAQALGADDSDTKVEWKIITNDNVCVGNPDASEQSGLQNLASYNYNDTVFNKVVQLDANNNDQTALTAPTGLNQTNGFTQRSYTFPVVCDNDDLVVVVRLETGSVAPDGNHDINITFHDVSWYVNDDTLELVAAYEDEDNNDLGVDDYIVGSLLVS